MAINFKDLETTYVSNGKSTLSGNLNPLLREADFSDINDSKDVSGIEIRMLPPFIKDNHTARVWPFPGYSKLYCLIIVASDVENQLAGGIDLKGFPRIGDHEFLPINKTIFYWQKAADSNPPNQIHVFSSVIKSKEGLRDVGKVLTSIKSDTDYKDLTSSLLKMVKDATTIGLVADVITQVAGIVGKYLGDVEDKPIGTVINSYTTLRGDFDELGVQKLVYDTKDIDFNFELIVRDKTKENLITEKVNANNTLLRSFINTTVEVLEDEKVEVELTPF